MHQPEEKVQSFPAVFHVWQCQAEANEAFANAWHDYALMIAAFQAALERAPWTSEVCAQIDIEQLLITELEYLADTVHTIFPRGGITEFASYATNACPMKLACEPHSQEALGQEAGLIGKMANSDEHKQHIASYQPKNVSVGRGWILMTSEDFINGYQAGHLAYMVEARAVTVTEEALITLLIDKLASHNESPRYRTGYIVGWIAALVSKAKKGNVL